MTVLDVLNEYKAYLIILERRNGNPADIEKAKIIIDAIEKQIKTPPIDKTSEYDGEYAKCPCCGAIVADYDDIYVCKHCGQKLDWSDTE